MIPPSCVACADEVTRFVAGLKVFIRNDPLIAALKVGPEFRNALVASVASVDE